MIGKRLIRLLTALIPVKRVRKRVRARWLARAQAERLAALAPRLRHELRILPNRQDGVHA